MNPQLSEHPLRNRLTRPGRTALAVLILAGSVAALTGCATSSPDSILPAAQSKDTNAPRPSRQPAGKPSPQQLGAGDDVTQTFPYTGHVETVKVPAGVHSVHVSLDGGNGSDWGTAIKDDNTWHFGYGERISGNLVVNPGDVLTIAVGGVGAGANGNKSPGNGGWSLNSHYAGGRGGSGYGSQTSDGGGGGGASVLQVNGQTVVVAGGGGGEGGAATKGVGQIPGGSAGANSGGDGRDSAWASNPDCNGKGGSSAHPGLDQNGHSYSGPLLEGGGGGGGGGRYTGGGGLADTGGGCGGGGGSSLYDQLSSVKGSLKGIDTEEGDGVVSLTWKGMTPPDRVVTVARTGTAGPGLLEIPGGNGQPATKVDVYWTIFTSPEPDSIAPFQVWTFHPVGTEGKGQLINKQTGLCLEVNGSTGAVDQWNCTEEANHLWKLMPNPDGGTALQVYVDGDMGDVKTGYYYLGTSVPGNQVKTPAPVVLLPDQSEKTSWTVSTLGS